MKNNTPIWKKAQRVGFYSLCLGSSFSLYSALQEISVPSLENISVSPTYYTPNPQDPMGDWIVYEGYYQPTSDRIWTPHHSQQFPGLTFNPTNDWFQTLASWPQGGVMSSTGYYNLFWNKSANGGVSFLCPKAFKYYPTPNVPTSGHFTIDLSVNPGSFSIIPPISQENPVVHWLESETGNMLRSVHYPKDQLIVYLAQGGVFQGAQFQSCPVNIQIPNGQGVSSSTIGRMTRYQVTDTNGFTYLIYTPDSLQLSWENQTLVSELPYSGYINMVCLPSNQFAEVSELLDAHARAVIIQAEGSFSADPQSLYDYSFTYSCVDLLNAQDAVDPLVLLMDHQVNKAHLVSSEQRTSLSLLCLKGNLQAYIGSVFQFKFPDTYHELSVNPLPAPGITQTQAIALIDDQVLDRGLDAAINSPAPTLSTPYNKFLYQKALTLVYAQRVISISGRPNLWESKLEALHQSLIDGMNNLWKGVATFPEKINGKIVQQSSGIRKDVNWGTVVFFPDSYGSAISLNDHIVQYGYPLYALTLLDQYENNAGILSKYLDQDSVIVSYKNKDLGDLLASDMGQSGGDNFIHHRNLDFYEGHSWLSGLGMSNDGQNTESESEALLGSMSIVAWLEQTGSDPTLIQTAINRWILETTSYQSYWQVDPNTTPYKDVCSEYVLDHLVASMVWQNKITAETYWGLEWDRIIGCVFMPASANLLDNFLGRASDLQPIVSSDYVKSMADYVGTHWTQFDTTNTIQSVLIPIVARSAKGDVSQPLGLPVSVQSMLDDLKSGRIQFDSGTNELILTVIAMYAQNQLQ
jgi:hypothetical protein